MTYQIKQIMTTNNKQLQSGDQLIVFGHLFTFLATAAETDNQYSIYEDQVPPMSGPPPHSHPGEELFYVVSGEFEFILNDVTKPFRVAPGQMVKVPPYAVHTFQNLGKDTGRLLTILLPGKFEAYFSATGIPVSDASQIPDLTEAPDFANMDLGKAFALAPQYDLNFYLPETTAAAN